MTAPNFVHESEVAGWVLPYQLSILASDRRCSPRLVLTLPSPIEEVQTGKVSLSYLYAIMSRELKKPDARAALLVRRAKQAVEAVSANAEYEQSPPYTGSHCQVESC